MAEASGRTALLAGASGLTGARLLQRLLAADEYVRVQALSRRPLLFDHPRLANRVLRFDAPLDSQLQGLRCQDAFCCLGTTIRDAGSQQAFRAVDHDLVLQFARAAQAAGAERLLVVSAVGADAGARNFYLRTKGETERALEAQRFRSLDIMAPSVLLGSRRTLRPLELMAQAALWLIGPLMLGGAARYRAISADTVAAAMLGAARSARLGVNRYGYVEMQALAAAVARESARL